MNGVLGRLDSLRPRMSNRTLLEVVILCLVVVIAVIYRVVRVRWGAYMDAYDPLFQYRVTEYIVKNGYSAWFTWHDTLSWYPMGRNIAMTSYPGIPFSGAALYFLLHALGSTISVHDVCLYYPVFMGAVTCIAVYFLGKDLGGSSTGIFAAIFMAGSEAFIRRTSFGFYDTENIGIFGMTVTSLFFLRSINEKGNLKRQVLYAVLAGLSLGYIFASWGAARYAVGLLILFMVASVSTRLFERRYLVSYAATLAVGFFIAILVPKFGIGYLCNTENILALALLVILILFDQASERLGERRAITLLGAAFLVVIMGVFTLESLHLIKPITGKYLNVIDPRRILDNPLYASVAEHHRSTWTNFFGFGLTLALGMYGVYTSITDMNSRRLYCALLFASSLYFTGSMTRLALILSIPASVMGAFGLVTLVSPFISLSKMQRRETRRGRRRSSLRGFSRELAFMFSVFIVIGTMPTFWGAAETAQSPTSLAYSGIPLTTAEGYLQDWLQALSWMKDNLADDAIVVSWWDWGYWIEAMANKTTIADGNTINMTHIGQIGKIFMLNQSESLPILKSLDATHVVVYHGTNPSDPDQSWSFGYNTIWTWMVEIAGLNMSDYIDPTQYSGELGQTEVARDSTLYNLMRLQPDPTFNLVYASEFGFLFVYEVDYEAGQT